MRPAGPGHHQAAVEAALDLASPCRLCPRRCGAERGRGEQGLCGVGWGAVLHRRQLHQGEEPPLVDGAGSGALFFTGCPLRCVYCQNHPFSQEGQGRPVSPADLAEIFLEFQAAGAGNVNLVTPGPHLPWVLAGLAAARQAGLTLPVVWNTSGYEAPEILDLLAGQVDVYLADARYSRSETARILSGAEDYVRVSRTALKLMLDQVGALQPDSRPIRGLIVRHLVLPGRTEETREVLRWIARELGTDVPVSLMGQYIPSHQAVEHPPLDRAPTMEEYTAAEEALLALGLEEGWTQPPEPPFDRDQFWGRGF